MDDVARGALFAALSPSGLAVANADDPRAVAELGRSPAKSTRTYGFSKGADYRIALREPRGIAGTRLRIERASGSPVGDFPGSSGIDADSPLLGDAGALAVAASLAVVEWLIGRAMTGEELWALSELDSGGGAAHAGSARRRER